jgi:hypothetical protein
MESNLFSEFVMQYRTFICFAALGDTFCQGTTQVFGQLFYILQTSIRIKPAALYLQSYLTYI